MTNRIGLVLCGFCASLSVQAIQTAGDLLVNIDVATLSSCTNNQTVTSWFNAGTLSGGFTNVMSGQGPLYSTNVSGYAAVTFAGSANSVMTNTVVPPASICDSNDWSVEAWVFNPAFSTTVAEDVLSWTGRNAWPAGNALGSCMEFRYGYDGNVLEHNGSANNVAWGTMPAANGWHHIAVTRNMLGLERVFADGKLVNMANPTLIRIRSDSSFTLGGTRDFGYTNTASAWINLFSGSIARLRIHDGALDSAGVVSNYLAECGNFGVSTMADSVWQGAANAALPWENAANWAGGLVPNGASRVVIDNGGTAVVSTAVGTIARFFPYNGGLVMSNNATLVVPVTAGANVYMPSIASNAFAFVLREGLFSMPGATSQNLYTGGSDTRVDITLGGGTLPAILDIDRDLHIGAGARGVARMTMEAGAEMYTSNGWIYVGVGGADAKLTMNGGLISHRRTGLDFVIGNNGSHSVLEINGGKVAPLQNLVWAYNGNAATYAAVNLNGGVIEAYRLYAQTTTGTNLLYLNGGTIRNRDTRSDSLNNTLTAAYVQSGGAVFDIITNTTLTVLQPLLADPNSVGGGLTKKGNGTLILSGTNTFTGGISVNSGSFLFSNANGLPADYSGTITRDTNAAIGLAKSGSVATLLARIANDSPGTLTLFTSNVSEAVDFSARPNMGLDFYGAVNYTGIYTPYNNGYVFEPQVAGGVYTPAIADGSAVSTVTVNGGPVGTIELNANSSYTGGTTINGGWLIMSHSNALGIATVGTPDIGIYNGAALKLNAVNIPTSIVQRIKSDSKGYILLGTVCTNLNLDLSALPGIIVGSDQSGLIYGAVINPANNTYRLGGGRLAYTSNYSLMFTNLLDGTDNAARTAVIEGAGTVRLAAGNTYSGGTVVSNSGALWVGADGGFGKVPATPDPKNLSVDGGVLRPASSSFTVNTNRGLTVGANGLVLAPASGITMTDMGDVNGSGAITNVDSGAVWFGGTNNTWNGVLSVNAGTVGAGSGSTFSWMKDNVIRAASGGSGNFGVNHNTDFAWSDKFARPLGDLPQADSIYPSGAGANIGLRKLGTGTLTVDVNPSYTRATSIENGTLKVGSALAIPVGSGKGDVSVANQNYTPPAMLDVNGYTMAINALSGSGILTNSQGGAIQLFAGTNNNSSTFFGAVDPKIVLTKTGSGTLTLNKGPALNMLRVEQGYVAASPEVAITGTVAMAGSGILRIGSATNEINGLNGEYYNFNQTGLTWIPSVTNFDNLARVNKVLAPYAPTLIINSSPVGTNFDFSTGAANKFQYGGANSADYEVGRWMGRFLAETQGTYGFSTASDDSSMLFIDGTTVVSNNYSQGYSLTTGKRGGTITMTPGWHDIVVTWFDGGGDAGLTVFMTPPGGTEAILPQRLLRPNPISVGRLDGSAYQTGIEFFSNNGVLMLNPSSDASYAGRLTGTNALQEIKKAGAFTQTFQQADFTGVVTVAEGTLAAQGVGKMTGPITVGNGTVLSVRATSNDWPNAGLTGVYYDNSGFDNNTFTSLTVIATYFNARTPSRIIGSHLRGANFDFAGGPGFPPPYNNSTYGVNFQALYKGKLLIAEAGTNVFELTSDDRSDLYIDSVQVITNAYSGGVKSGIAYLSAGTHDVLVTFQQGTGGYGLALRYTPPGGAKVYLPNAMLRPSPWEVGSLNDQGNGAIDLAHTGSFLRVTQATNQLFSGAFDGPNGAQVEKNGGATLALGGNNNAYSGTWYVCQGELCAGNGGTAGTLGGSNVYVSGGATLTFSRSDDITYAGDLAGWGRIRSIGAGKVTLTGNASAFAGTVQTSAGQQITLTDLPGTNTLISNNGTLGLSGTQVVLDASQIAGAGSVRLSESATLTLGLTQADYANELVVSNGVLALAVTNMSSAWHLSRLTLNAGSSLQVGASGLWGKYYDIAYDNATVSNAFATYAAATNYFATKTPALVASTWLQTNGVDFGSTGTNFPGKYKGGAANFAAQYVGKIRITEPGTYTFGVTSDDNGIIYVDGQVIANGNYNKGVVLKSGTVALTAGLHDFALFFAQGSGGYGLYADITFPGDTVSRRLPNSMLVANPADTPAYSLTVDTLAVTNGPGTGTVSLLGGGILKMQNLWIDTGAELAVTGAVAAATSELTVTVPHEIPYGVTEVGDFAATAGWDVSGLALTARGTEGKLRYRNSSKKLYLVRNNGSMLMLR